MSFTPHTPEDIKVMLDKIGVRTLDDLFDEVPPELLAPPLEHIPSAMSEGHLLKHAKTLAGKNQDCESYLGGGAYEHHIPAACWQLASRGEYYTAYTPYQAEASQGALQLIYEYQTMMARLTGMEVSNASMYDGATALTEAILMAIRLQGKKAPRRILIAGSINPHYLETLKTFLKQQKIEIECLPTCPTKGTLLPDALDRKPPYAALVIQQPNFYGGLEEVDALTDATHQHGGLVIASVNPISLGALKEPGAWGKTGADIVCGEGQPLGNFLNAGGPYFGFMTTRKAFVRQMPGRIVGRTVDKEGRDAFTLTLQAREQHIRRSKATSNICTNQGLMVVAATIYMSLMGETGVKSVAESCFSGAHYLESRLSEALGLKSLFSSAFFHEFVVELPVAASQFVKAMLKKGISPGIPLSKFKLINDNALLICVTETKTKADLDKYVLATQEVLAKVRSETPAESVS